MGEKHFGANYTSYRNYGFNIAVDDIGGGFASLESIVVTKPSYVKIDTHIVQNIKNDKLKESIVRFISTFCKENKMICIGEGIETKEDLDLLIEMGVDAGQGYLLCRPASGLDLAAVYQDIQSRLHLTLTS